FVLHPAGPRRIQPLRVLLLAGGVESLCRAPQQALGIFEVPAGIAEVEVVQLDASAKHRTSRLEQVAAQLGRPDDAIRIPPARRAPEPARTEGDHQRDEYSQGELHMPIRRDLAVWGQHPARETPGPAPESTNFAGCSSRRTPDTGSDQRTVRLLPQFP